MKKNKAKILYIVNHVAFFVSHRLPIAMAARDDGFCINLISGQAGSPSMEVLAMSTLNKTRLCHERVSISSGRLNLLSDLIGLIQLIKKVSEIRPEIIHCISPKGVIYGGLAARFTRTKNIVVALSGMGFVFTQGRSSNQFRNFLSKIYQLLFTYILRHPNLRVIVQNNDDQLTISKMGLDPKQIILIPGSGVDLKKFIDIKIETKEPIVLLPARMLWDKGIWEFIQAARQLKTLAPEWRFILAGAADYQNPTSIPIECLEALNSEQGIEWVGYRNDMTPYFAKASIVCLPSYREGMPKCLLEGAAAGCAIVTTDVVGCREAILPNVSGLLVPSHSSQALKNALLLLINDRGLRESFGHSGRQLAITKFSIDAVIKNTLSIYRDFLKNEKR